MSGNNSKISRAALWALVLTAISCTGELDPGMGTSRGIPFSPRSYGGAITKTTYTGDGEKPPGGSLTRERIQWQKDDWFTIVSAQALVYDSSQPPQLEFNVPGATPYSTANYRILTHQTLQDNVTSRATIAPVEETGLQWGQGEHTFYAMYPSRDTIFTAAEAAKVGLTLTQFRGTIPTVQTPQWDNGGYPQMQYAYMFASATAAAGAKSVNLLFHPQFTAFEFTVEAGEEYDVVELTSFSFEATEGDALTGDFQMTINGSALESLAPQNSSSPFSNKITVNFPANTTVKAATGGEPAKNLTFTVLGLPSNVTSMKMTFVGPSIGTRSIIVKNLDDTPIEFTACRKYRITGISFPEFIFAGGEQILWNQEAFGEDILWEDGDYTPLSLVSQEVTYLGGEVDIAPAEGFQSSMTAQGGGTSLPVPYAFQHLEGGNWVDGLPDWLSPDPSIDFGGTAAPSRLKLKAERQIDSYDPTSIENPHTAELRSRAALTGVDLSLLNVATGGDVLRSTANCYVVDAPGTYRFPAVYGNALKDGAPNYDSYAPFPQGNNGVDVYHWNDAAKGWLLSHFKDHLGANINSPYIGIQHAGKSLSARLMWTDAPDLVTDVTLEGTGQNTQISFSVPAGTICQGNAVIALIADGHVAWSWHIWVTDEPQTSSSVDWFSPANIGWSSPRDALFRERICSLRVVQPSSGRVSSVAVITQTSATFPVTGSNTYYQWGRKDPMPPIYFVNGDKRYTKTCYGPYPPAIKYEAENVQPMELWDAIQRPDYFYYPQSGDSGSRPERYDMDAVRSYEQMIKDGDIGSFHYYRRGEQLLGRIVNLWDASLTQQLYTDALDVAKSSAGFNSALETVISGSFCTKTIYDPSPVGYRVPNRNEMRALFTDHNVVWPSGASGHEGKTIGQAYRYYLIDGSLMISPMGSYNNYSTGYDNVGAFGIYWTAHEWSYVHASSGAGVPYESAVTLQFYQTTPGHPITYGSGWYSNFKTNGLPVRPIAESHTNTN